MSTDKTYTPVEVQEMFKIAWQSIIRHPMSQVCKHWSALEVIQAMPEELMPPVEIIKAIVESNDDISLFY